MAISRADFWYFLTELVTRNPTMGIPALEDGLFVNLLIFNYVYYFPRAFVWEVDGPWEVSHLFSPEI